MLSRKAPVRARNRRRAARALSVAGAAIFAVACGEDDQDRPPAQSRTELTITLDADGTDGNAEQRATLTCPGGPADACAVAARLRAEDAAPVPPETICTEIYGGPDVVTLDGVLNREQVAAELTRANGCEIERFDRFTALLRALFPGYRPGASLRP